MLRATVGSFPQSSVCTIPEGELWTDAWVRSIWKGKNKKGKYKSDSTAATVHLVKHGGGRGRWLRLPLPAGCCGCIPAPLTAPTADASSPERRGHGASSGHRQTPWSEERCGGLPRARVPPRSGRVLKLLRRLFGHLLFARVGSRGLQGVLPGATDLVQCCVFESAKMVSGFLFCLAKD